MRQIALKLPIGILALLIATGAAAQTKLRVAGEAIAVAGPVTQQKGSTSPTVVKAGTDIPRGNTVQSGAGGVVRLRMADNSYIALPSDSALQVEKFSLPRAGKTKQPGTAVYSLLKGGLRTVTGLIGKISNDIYKLKAGNASVEIKGTDYGAYRCQNNCSANGVNAENGLYVEVHSGAVVLTNGNGLLTLSAGEYGVVADAEGSVPRKLEKRPVVFEVSGGIFNPAADISGGASGEAGTDGAEVQTEPPRIEPPASPSSP